MLRAFLCRERENSLRSRQEQALFDGFEEQQLQTLAPETASTSLYTHNLRTMTWKEMENVQWFDANVGVDRFFASAMKRMERQSMEALFDGFLSGNVDSGLQPGLEPHRLTELQFITEPFSPLWAALLPLALLGSYLATLIFVAFFTLLERKLMGLFQRREGPDRLGVEGLGQPFADGLKLLLKQLLVIKDSPKLSVYFFAPIISL